MGKVVTKEWRKAKSAKLEFAFVSASRDNSSFYPGSVVPLAMFLAVQNSSIGDLVTHSLTH